MRNESLSISTPRPTMTSGAQQISLGLFSLAVLMFLVVFATGKALSPLVLPGAVLLCVLSVSVFIHQEYVRLPEGIKNNGVWFKSLSARGIWGWIAGIILTGFYVLLYWFPLYLGLRVENGANTGLVALFDPLSKALSGNPASQWFMYGTLYTVAILIMGIKFIYKYRHNNYEIFRTISVMFFQLGFAFLLPEFLQRLNNPYYNFANMWPLNYYFFDEWHINGLLNTGNFGLFMLLFGVAMVVLISPILTYKYGKRWYCSWVCGCGGLAETAGDPFRQLSDKSLKAWKVERWLIHSVLLFSLIMTAAVLYSLFQNNPTGYWVTKPMFVGIFVGILALVAALLKFKPTYFKSIDKKALPFIYGIIVVLLLFVLYGYISGSDKLFFMQSGSLRQWYGFAIGSAFSGVVGVGFYPIMGSRVWCRFGCPMAAILGLQQKFFSRFRITTNGGQCISCGNCSTYCEMGIDVRHYAQRGQDIVRASCVGCGVCSAVCPRGVLRLEGASEDIDTRALDIRNERVVLK